jgi:hypothetical protein
VDQTDKEPGTWADCPGSKEAGCVSVWDGTVGFSEIKQIGHNRTIENVRSFDISWKLEVQLHSGAFWVFVLESKIEYRWGLDNITSTDARQV